MRKILESIEITTSAEDYGKAADFTDDLLKRNDITGTVYTEVMLVFEALYHDIVEQNPDAAPLIRITGQNSLGDIKIRFGYKGKPFVRTDETGDELSPEGRVLRAYADRIDCSYHSGYNNISISVKRSPRRAVISCALAIVLATVVYALIHLTASTETAEYISENIVVPFEVLFARAMLMIAGPVTFFSLLKNLTDTYIFSERMSDKRNIQRQTLITSVISIILSLLVSIPVAVLMRSKVSILDEYEIVDISKTPLPEMISSLVPVDIFAMFQAISPFPMIVVAIIMTYAFCSSGRYFDSMKKATDACYSLFSSMLTLVMFSLPMFAFASFLDMLLSKGMLVLMYIFQFTLFVISSLIIMDAFYAVRLKLGGVAVRPFVRDLTGLVTENIKINSAIDAVPFNIRYCMRHYKISRKCLEQNLPVLAQINLDGNCFVLTMITVIIMMFSGTPLSYLNIAAIAALVLFLSLGAPNQPGSVLLGLLILMSFLKIDDLLPVAIYCEVVFGSLLNLINVIGDIVTVAILDRKNSSMGNE